ncbi:hypothetical protein [Streptomyces huasconensis]|uniref:hypothetical protein n=1 Tax=Streptomyces huasconensis TaxID=1854574 RepID=UPI0037003644
MTTTANHTIGPPLIGSYADRDALLQARSTALRELIRADRSLPRALLSLICALALSLGVLLITSLLVGVVTREDGAPSTTSALLVSLGALVVLVGLPAMALNRHRSRGLRLWAAIKQWTVLDRHPEALALADGDPSTVALGQMPENYGTGALPRLRLIVSLAGCLSAGVVGIAVAAAPGLSSRESVGWACALLTFAVYAGASVRKASSRSNWVNGENRVRGLSRARAERRTQLAATSPGGDSDGRIPPQRFPVAVLWYGLPLLVTVALYVGNAPDSATGYVIAGIVCAAGLVTAVLLVARTYAREKKEYETAAAALALRFPEKRIHAVRHGLLPESLVPVEGLAAWDFGPPRVSGLMVDERSLTLLGTGEERFEVAHADMLGATVIRVPHHDIELHLGNGPCLLIRSPEPQALVDDLRAVGLRVNQVTGP